MMKRGTVFILVIAAIFLVTVTFGKTIYLSPNEKISVQDPSFNTQSIQHMESSGLDNEEMKVLSEKKILYSKGEAIVKFNSEEGVFHVELVNKLSEKYQVYEYIELFPNIDDNNLRNIFLIKFPEDKEVLEMINDYNTNENVEYAEPNFLIETSQISQPNPAVSTTPPLPNDPLYSQQWNLPRIYSVEAWANITAPSSVPVIAVIDTGVQWNHLDLASNIWINSLEIPNNNLDDDQNGFIDDVRGWDFVETNFPCYAGEDCSLEDNDPNDFQGHGTHVAGIAGAVTNNGIGVAGTCSNFCKIMPVRAGFTDQYGGGALETDDIAQSLIYATDNGANIISMSFGGFNSNLVQNAINYAFNQGVILVAAAGNSGVNDPLMAYPAAYPNVIAVGASDQNDQREWRFTNHGAWVDISAPGTDIRSTISPTSPMNAYPQYSVYCPSLSECYLQLSGTSMAAPLVSGVIGLALAKNPSLTQDQILTLVHSSSDLMPPLNPGWPWGYTGTGRINAFETVQSNYVSLALLNPNLDHSVNGPQNLQIGGIASGQNFQKYRLDIAYGGDLPLNPSWINVKSDTFIPVNNGLLGTLNPNALNLWPGTYTLRLLVTDINGKTWEDRTVFVVDTTLVKGWGKTISDSTDSPPVYADINNDNKKELFFNALHSSNTINNVFYAIDHNSLPLAGWPISNFQQYSWFLTNAALPAAAVDNIDNDSSLEAVYVTPYSTIAQYSVYETTGALQPGWPVTGMPLAWSRVAPVIANVNGGSDKEVIVASEKRGGLPQCGDPEHKIYVYGSNGQLLPGWPQTVNCAPAGISTGDVDSNGDMEIIISTHTPFLGPQPNKELYIFNHDGPMLPGWPQMVSGESYPSLADIDKNDNGRLEIVQIDGNGTMYVLNDNGTLLAGWPQTVSSSWYWHSDPAIADVDSNGDMEIVVIDGGYRINVMNHDGTVLNSWPIGTYAENLLIADLDGDGFKELIVGYGGRPAWISIYKYDGTYLESKPLMYDSSYSYAAGDINGNELIDLFAIDALGNTYLWEFSGRASNQNLPWPMYRHDAQNTGKYP